LNVTSSQGLRDAATNSSASSRETGLPILDAFSLHHWINKHTKKTLHGELGSDESSIFFKLVTEREERKINSK